MNTDNIEHRDNFIFIRLFFSCIIVIAHSYTLSGSEWNDWVSILTGGQTNFGLLCFKFFFVISGYLIFASLIRSRSIGIFFWKRFLRVYPALITALIATVLYGNFVYEGNIDYIRNPDVITYIPNNLFLLDLQYGIKGIFEKNPYKSVINGSLWSLPYEILFYILITFLFFIRKKPTYLWFALLFACILLYIVNLFFEHEIASLRFYKILVTYFFDLAAFFIAGAFLAASNFNNTARKYLWVLGGLIFLVLSLHFSVFKEFQYLTLPIIIIPVCLSSTKYIRDTEKYLGDISYGVYIYSFPIQQTLVHYFKFGYLELIATSLPISLIFGYLSWHIIEKKAVRLKYILPINIFAVNPKRHRDL